ncbi:hypothetical protein LTR08_001375 [Meristemomyces frigidus]|nr:hypothetical protein LTR08_001375 [Meristemomyces frigidus]
MAINGTNNATSPLEHSNNTPNRTSPLGHNNNTPDGVSLNGITEHSNNNNNTTPQKVMFFDIDNCLYPKSHNIHAHMSRLIDAYFQTHLALTPPEATALHQQYYQDYGLAIEGLVRHHKVDPLAYNSQVDDALPLEQHLKPDPALRALISSIKREGVKLWLFTNAYRTHALRVVALLAIADLFEGVTYCDYASPPLLCKPSPAMYAKAMREAGVADADRALCYFVDDSALNVAGAKKYGWRAVQLVEGGTKAPVEMAGEAQIEALGELRDVFPELFGPGAVSAR